MRIITDPTQIPKNMNPHGISESGSFCCSGGRGSEVPLVGLFELFVLLLELFVLLFELVEFACTVTF